MNNMINSVSQLKYRRTESNILDILLVIIRRNYDNASITAINTGYLFQVLQILFTFFFKNTILGISCICPSLLKNASIITQVYKWEPPLK